MKWCDRAWSRSSELAEKVDNHNQPPIICDKNSNNNLHKLCKTTWAAEMQVPLRDTTGNEEKTQAKKSTEEKTDQSWQRKQKGAYEITKKL